LGPLIFWGPVRAAQLVCPGLWRTFSRGN
jgi:hypothetical protein